MTLAEVRREISHVKNRITCIITDQDRDSRRVYEEYRRGQEPLERQLYRLCEQHREAEELIEMHEQKIEELGQQLKACMNAANIKKMVALIRRANGIKTKMRHDKLAHLESRVTNARTSTLQFLIKGYSNEIERLKRLVKDDGKRFVKLRDPLVHALEVNRRYFNRFLDHKRRGHELLDEAYVELDRLRKIERDLGGDKKIQKLSDKAQQLMDLMLSMPPEIRQMMMERAGQSGAQS